MDVGGLLFFVSTIIGYLLASSFLSCHHAANSVASVKFHEPIRGVMIDLLHLFYTCFPVACESSGSWLNCGDGALKHN